MIYIKNPFGTIYQVSQEIFDHMILIDGYSAPTVDEVAAVTGDQCNLESSDNRNDGESGDFNIPVPKEIVGCIVNDDGTTTLTFGDDTTLIIPAAGVDLWQDDGTFLRPVGPSNGLVIDNTTGNVGMGGDPTCNEQTVYGVMRTDNGFGNVHHPHYINSNPTSLPIVQIVFDSTTLSTQRSLELKLRHVGGPWSANVSVFVRITGGAISDISVSYGPTLDPAVSVQHDTASVYFYLRISGQNYLEVLGNTADERCLWTYNRLSAFPAGLTQPIQQRNVFGGDIWVRNRAYSPRATFDIISEGTTKSNHNEINIADALKRMKELRIGVGRYNGKMGTKAGDQYYAPIAHEYAEIYPEAVSIHEIVDSDWVQTDENEVPEKINVRTIRMDAAYADAVAICCHFAMVLPELAKSKSKAVQEVANALMGTK